MRDATAELLDGMIARYFPPPSITVGDLNSDTIGQVIEIQHSDDSTETLRVGRITHAKHGVALIPAHDPLGVSVLCNPSDPCRIITADTPYPWTGGQA